MRIIKREEWANQPPARPWITNQLPWPNLDLHHTATPQWSAVEAAPRIEFDHRNRGWRSGAYNFLVDVNGAIIEMIPPGRQHLNSGIPSGTIALIGNFETSQVPQPMVEAVSGLIAHGALQGWWPAKITRTHSQMSATACPGRWAKIVVPIFNQNAYDIIEQLKHDSGLERFVNIALPVLRLNDRGGAVKSLQTLLKVKATQNLEVDGVFGAQTRQAVINVQRFFHLPSATGVVDAETWGVLFL